MGQSILLDTCTFLWIVRDAPELSPTARSLFSAPENTIYLSAVSAWEIAVKHKAGRLPLADSPQVYVPSERSKHGILPLGLEEEAVCALSRLPEYHQDPFDRMLICQSIVHGFVLLSPDAHIHRYPVNVKW
jgi:PIN domain nuclease of toxin-antitoxin system